MRMPPQSVWQPFQKVGPRQGRLRHGFSEYYSDNQYSGHGPAFLFRSPVSRLRSPYLYFPDTGKYVKAAVKYGVKLQTQPEVLVGLPVRQEHAHTEAAEIGFQFFADLAVKGGHFCFFFLILKKLMLI